MYSDFTASSLRALASARACRGGQADLNQKLRWPSQTSRRQSKGGARSGIGQNTSLSSARRGLRSASDRRVGGPVWQQAVASVGAGAALRPPARAWRCDPPCPRPAAVAQGWGWRNSTWCQGQASPERRCRLDGTGRGASRGDHRRWARPVHPHLVQSGNRVAPGAELGVVSCGLTHWPGVGGHSGRCVAAPDAACGHRGHVAHRL